MSRSKGRTSNSVSLFPFLAVLVCAMGALIFLLLVTTRRIRHNAVMDAIVAAETTPETPIIIPVDVPVAEPDEPPEAPVVPPPSAVAAPEPEVVVEERPDPNAKLEQLIAALARQRDEQQQQYEAGRRLVSAAQSKLTDAETQLDQLKQAFKTRQAAGLTTDVERTVARAEYTRLGEEIDAAIVHLRRMQQENATRSSKFTVVPFDGQSGTTRRPILIECTKNGLTFMQERITLTANDVDGFTAQVNPLLAGTRALVLHWSQKRQAGESDEGAPYVLLIVRPSGSIAYYAARNLLSELSQETGYELVAGDRELDIPPPDPVATEACRRAVQVILAERQRVNDTIAAARRGADDVLRFKRGGNGFEVADREPTLQERLGQPGFGREKGNGRGGLEGDGNANGPSPGNGNGTAATGGGRFARTVQPGSESGGRGQFAGRSPGGRTLGSRTPGGRTTGVRAPGQGGTRGLPAAGEFDSPFAAGNRSGEFPRGGDGADTGGNTTDGTGGKTGTGGVFGEGQFAQGSKGAPAGSRGESGNLTEGGADSIAGRFQPGSSGTRGTGTSAANASQSDGGTNRTGDASQSSNSAGTGSGQRGGSSNGGQGEQSSGGGSATGSGSSSAGSMESQPPSPLRTFGRTAGQPVSRAGSRQTRRSWGIGSARNGIGFERETKISVTQDVIRVGTQPEIEIARFKHMADLTEKVLDDLDRHARTWGVPPKNFHWVPVVRFLVSPGGNLYYERLNSPLKKLGISSTVEYPLDSPTYRRRTE